MKFVAGALAASVAVAGAFVGTAAAAGAVAAPPNNGITVRLVDSPTGPNCPGINPPEIDKGEIIIRYNGFKALQPGPLDKRSATCRFHLELTYPAGLTFSVHTARHKGWVQAQAGATAMVEASHMFADSQIMESVKDSFTGSVDREWTLDKKSNRDVLAPCGGKTVDLDIEQSLAVAGDPKIGAIISMVYSQHKSESRYTIPTRSC
jgi:hypothetical protein